jgi:hypothetical protein
LDSFWPYDNSHEVNNVFRCIWIATYIYQFILVVDN